MIKLVKLANIDHIWRKMKNRIFTLLILIILVASACSGSNGGASQTSDTIPTTSPPTTAASENLSTTQDEVENIDPGSTEKNTSGLVSECTLVSSSREENSEQAEIFAVTEDDWVLGPDDAAVTLIEYGDFQ